MTRLPQIAGHYKLNKNQDGLFKLTEIQEVIFNDFLELLDSSDLAGKIRILYRGENLNSLQRKLGGDISTSTGISDLYKKCFFVGDKAKEYLLAGNSVRLARNWDFNIGKADPGDFKFIFEEISKLVKGNNAYIFSQIENDFCAYFNAIENLPQFVSTLTEIDNENELLAIRDYYLWILHNLGADSFKFSSYFISSTCKLSVARSCAYQEGEVSGPVVFLYFVPSPTIHFGLNLDDINTISSKMEGLMLPSYINSIYEEDETSLKGALFPHFIFGIYEFNTGRFIMNHHFFKKENISISHVQNAGLIIDQQNFEDFLKETNYDGGVLTDRTGTFQTI
jgi:hypothetical protein